MLKLDDKSIFKELKKQCPIKNISLEGFDDSIIFAFPLKKSHISSYKNLIMNEFPEDNYSNFYFRLLENKEIIINNPDILELTKHNKDRLLSLLSNKFCLLNHKFLEYEKRSEICQTFFYFLKFFSLIKSDENFIDSKQKMTNYIKCFENFESDFQKHLKEKEKFIPSEIHDLRNLINFSISLKIDENIKKLETSKNLRYKIAYFFRNSLIKFINKIKEKLIDKQNEKVSNKLDGKKPIAKVNVKYADKITKNKIEPRKNNLIVSSNVDNKGKEKSKEESVENINLIINYLMNISQDFSLLYGVLMSYLILKEKNIESYIMEGFDLFEYLKYNQFIQNENVEDESVLVSKIKNPKLNNYLFMFKENNQKENKFYLIDYKTSIAFINNIIFLYNPSYGLLKFLLNESNDLNLIDVNIDFPSLKFGGQIHYLGPDNNGILILIPDDFLTCEFEIEKSTKNQIHLFDSQNINILNFIKQFNSRAENNNEQIFSLEKNELFFQKIKNVFHKLRNFHSNFYQNINPNYFNSILSSIAINHLEYPSNPPEGKLENLNYSTYEYFLPKDYIKNTKIFIRKNYIFLLHPFLSLKKDISKDEIYTNTTENSTSIKKEQLFDYLYKSANFIYAVQIFEINLVNNDVNFLNLIPLINYKNISFDTKNNRPVTATPANKAIKETKFKEIQSKNNNIKSKLINPINKAAVKQEKQSKESGEKISSKEGFFDSFININPSNIIFLSGKIMMQNRKNFSFLMYDLTSLDFHSLSFLNFRSENSPNYIMKETSAKNFYDFDNEDKELLTTLTLFSPTRKLLSLSNYSRTAKKKESKIEKNPYLTNYLSMFNLTVEVRSLNLFEFKDWSESLFSNFFHWENFKFFDLKNISSSGKVKINYEEIIQSIALVSSLRSNKNTGSKLIKDLDKMVFVYLPGLNDLADGKVIKLLIDLVNIHKVKLSVNEEKNDIQIEIIKKKLLSFIILLRNHIINLKKNKIDFNYLNPNLNELILLFCTLKDNIMILLSEFENDYSKEHLYNNSAETLRNVNDKESNLIDIDLILKSQRKNNNNYELDLELIQFSISLIFEIIKNSKSLNYKKTIFEIFCEIFIKIDYMKIFITQEIKKFKDENINLGKRLNNLSYYLNLYIHIKFTMLKQLSNFLERNQDYLYLFMLNSELFNFISSSIFDCLEYFKKKLIASKSYFSVENLLKDHIKIKCLIFGDDLEEIFYKCVNFSDSIEEKEIFRSFKTEYFNYENVLFKLSNCLINFVIDNLLKSEFKYKPLKNNEVHEIKIINNFDTDFKQIHMNILFDIFQQLSNSILITMNFLIQNLIQLKKNTDIGLFRYLDILKKNFLFTITKTIFNYMNLCKIEKLKNFIYFNYAYIMELFKNYSNLIYEYCSNENPRDNKIPIIEKNDDGNQRINTYFIDFDFSGKYEITDNNKKLPKVDFTLNNRSIIHSKYKEKSTENLKFFNSIDFCLRKLNKTNLDDLNKENEKHNYFPEYFDLYIKIDIIKQEQYFKHMKSAKFKLFTIYQRGTEQENKKIFEYKLNFNGFKTSELLIIKNLNSETNYIIDFDFFKFDTKKAYISMRFSNYKFDEFLQDDFLISMRNFINKSFEFFSFYKYPLKNDISQNGRCMEILQSQIFSENRENFYQNIFDQYLHENENSDEIDKINLEEMKNTLLKIIEDEKKYMFDLSSFVEENKKNLKNIIQYLKKDEKNEIIWKNVYKTIQKFDYLDEEIKRKEFEEINVLNRRTSYEENSNYDLDLKKGKSSSSFISKKSSSDFERRRSQIIINTIGLLEIKFEDFVNIKERTRSEFNFKESFDLFSSTGNNLLNENVAYKDFYLHLINKLLNLFEFLNKKLNKDVIFKGEIPDKLSFALYFSLVIQDKNLILFQDLLRQVFFEDEENFNRYTTKFEDLELNSVILLLEIDLFELFYSIYRDCSSIRRQYRQKKDFILQEIEDGNSSKLVEDRLNNFKNTNFRKEIEIYENLFNFKFSLLSENVEELQIDIVNYFTEWMKKLNFIFFFCNKKNFQNFQKFSHKNSEGFEEKISYIKKNSMTLLRKKSKVYDNNGKDVNITNKIRKSLLGNSSFTELNKNRLEKSKKKTKEYLKSILDFVTDDKIYIYDLITNLNVNHVKILFREISLSLFNNFVFNDLENIEIQNFFLTHFNKMFAINSKFKYDTDENSDEIQKKKIFSNYEIPNLYTGLYYKSSVNSIRLDFLFEEYLSNLMNLIVKMSEDEKIQLKINHHYHLANLINFLNWKISEKNLKFIDNSKFFDKFFCKPNSHLLKCLKTMLFSSPLKKIFTIKKLQPDPNYKHVIHSQNDESIYEFYDLMYLEKSYTLLFQNYSYFIVKNVLKHSKQSSENNFTNSDENFLLEKSLLRKIFNSIYSSIYQQTLLCNDDYCKEKIDNNLSTVKNVNGSLEFQIICDDKVRVYYVTEFQEKELFLRKVWTRENTTNNILGFIYTLMLLEDKGINGILFENHEENDLNQDDLFNERNKIRNIFSNIFLFLKQDYEENFNIIFKIFKIFIKESLENLSICESSLDKNNAFIQFLYQITKYFYSYPSLKAKSINITSYFEFLQKEKCLGERNEVLINQNFIDKYKEILILLFFDSKTIVDVTIDQNSEFINKNSRNLMLAHLYDFLFEIMTFERLKLSANNILKTLLQNLTQENKIKMEMGQYQDLQHKILNIYGMKFYNVKDYTNIINNVQLRDSYFSGVIGNDFIEGKRIYLESFEKFEAKKNFKYEFSQFFVNYIYESKLNSRISVFIDYVTKLRYSLSFDKSWGDCHSKKRIYKNFYNKNYKHRILITPNNQCQFSVNEKNLMDFQQIFSDFENCNINTSWEFKIFSHDNSFILNENFYHEKFINNLNNTVFDENLFEFLDIMIDSFNISFIKEKEAFICTIKNNILILRFFKLILLEYEKIKSFENLSEIKDIEIKKEIEDEENEETQEKILFAKKNNLIKKCFKKIMNFFNTNKNQIESLIVYTDNNTHINPNYIFNFEKIFLFLPIEILINLFSIETEFYVSREINSSEFNVYIEDVRKEINKHEEYLGETFKEPYFFKFCKNFEEKLSNRLIQFKFELNLKLIGFHLLNQDIRFIMYYLKYLDIEKDKSTYVSNREVDNDERGKLFEIAKKEILNLKCIKILYSQAFHKYFYFDIKEEYNIIKRIMSKIIKNLFDLIYRFSKQNLDDWNQIFKYIMDEIDLLLFPQESDNLELNWSEKKIINNKVAHFDIDIFEMIKSYIIEKFDEEIKNRGREGQNFKKNEENKNNLIDINVNLFEKNNFSNDIFEFYSIDIINNIFKLLIPKNYKWLYSYSFKDEKEQKNNENYINKSFDFLNNLIEVLCENFEKCVLNNREDNKGKNDNTFKVFNNDVNNLCIKIMNCLDVFQEKEGENITNNDKTKETKSHSFLLEIKSKLTKNPLIFKILKEFIMKFFKILLKTNNSSKSNRVLSNYLNIIYKMYDFLKLEDYMENTVESFKFKKFLNKKLGELYLSNNSNTKNLKLPNLSNFYYIKLLNKNNNQLKFNFSNSAEFPDSFIYINPSKNKFYSIDFFNDIHIEEFKRQRKMIGNTKHRLQDFCYVDELNSQMIIYPDDVKNLEKAFLEVTPLITAFQITSKLEGNLKNSMKNFYVGLNNQMILTNKKFRNEFKDDDSIKNQIDKISKDEKIINIFDNSIIITDKNIYIFFENPLNDDNLVDEFHRNNSRISFESHKYFLSKSFTKGICNKNSILLLTEDNKLFYRGKQTTEDLISNTKYSFFTKIRALENFRCFDFAALKNTLFFLLEPKYIVNSENKSEDRMIKRQLYYIGLFDEDLTSEEAKLKSNENTLKIVTNFEKNPIKKIKSNNYSLIAILAEDNNVYLFGNLFYYSGPKNEVTYCYFKNFCLWDWPIKNNFVVIDIVDITYEYVIFLLKNINNNQIEYYLIGNYKYEDVLNKNLALEKSRLFHKLNDPIKINFLNIDDKNDKKSSLNLTKEDANSKVNPSNNKVKPSSNIKERILNSKTPVKINNIKTPIKKDNFKTPVKNKNESVISNRPISNSELLNEMSISTNSIIESAIKNNNQQKIDVYDIDKIYHLNCPRNKTLKYFSLFYLNKYNEMKYLNELNFTLDMTIQTNIISIFKINTENLKHYENWHVNFTQYCDYDHKLNRLVYLLIKINFNESKKSLTISPILKTDKHTQYDLSKESIGVLLQNQELSNNIAKMEKILFDDSDVNNHYKLINVDTQNEIFDYISNNFNELKCLIFSLEELVIDLKKPNPTLIKQIQKSDRIIINIEQIIKKGDLLSHKEDIILSEIHDCLNITKEDFFNFANMKKQYQLKKENREKEEEIYLEEFKDFYFKSLNYSKQFKLEKKILNLLMNLNEEIIKDKFYEIMNLFYNDFLSCVEKLLSDKDSKYDYRIKRIKQYIIFLNSEQISKFIKDSIGTFYSYPNHTIKINRAKALNFQKLNVIDSEFKNTIFAQYCNEISDFNREEFLRPKGVNVAITELVGEGASDGGGPSREIFSSIFEDLLSNRHDLLIKSPNNITNNGNGRDLWIINPSANSDLHLKYFKDLGKIFVYSFFSNNYCKLRLPKLFWKHLTEEEFTIEDLEEIDIYSYNSLRVCFDEDFIENSMEFPLSYFNFSVTLSNGVELDLIENGNKINVNKNNYRTYRELYLEKRFRESIKQIEAIKEGIKFVLKEDYFTLLTYLELEKKICGVKKFDLALFKKNTEWSGLHENNKIKENFWKYLEEADDEKRFKYLKFVWGRTTLPINSEEFSSKHRVYVFDDEKKLPVSHTCGFSLDLPLYKTYEKLKAKMNYAINNSFCISDGGNFDFNV